MIEYLIVQADLCDIYACFVALHLQADSKYDVVHLRRSYNYLCSS